MRTKWIYTILVLALSLFVTSCSDREVADAGNKKTRTIVFRLAVSDAVGSRAAWETNDSQKHGTAMENRIDLNGLRVAIYSINQDNTVGPRIGVAENLLYWNINEGDNNNADDPIEYQLVGDISNVALEEGERYRFMVYANFPSNQNNNFSLTDIDVNDGYIPMWGVITHQISGGELEELGTIDLLRAAAKIEVNFTDTFPINEYTISNVAIKNYNRTGNNLPTGWDDCEKTEALDMENCINVTSDHIHGVLSFTSNKDVNDNTYTIYLPEYSNVSHADDKSVVQVTLRKDEHEKTYDIPFCEYTEQGAPVLAKEYNVVRNHIYRFNITRVAAGSLKLNFEVADWEKATNLPTLVTIDYPTYVNPLLPEKDFDYRNKKINKEPVMKMSGSNTEPFTAWFHFEKANGTPVEGSYVWVPTIIDQESSAYKIEVYKHKEDTSEELVYSTENQTNNTLATQYEGCFKIVVTPKNQSFSNKIFTLGIACTVHPSGFPSDNFFLFINGENDNIAWPNSGNDRKFIQIKQIVE